MSCAVLSAWVSAELILLSRLSYVLCVGMDLESLRKVSSALSILANEKQKALKVHYCVNMAVLTVGSPRRRAKVASVLRLAAARFVVLDLKTLRAH